jgi:hypothetical protein
MRGTGLRRCPPDAQGRDSGEARRKRGGAGAAAGAGRAAGERSVRVRADGAVPM